MQTKMRGVGVHKPRFAHQFGCQVPVLDTAATQVPPACPAPGVVSGARPPTKIFLLRGRCWLSCGTLGFASIWR
jgi:hypothetical protein